MDSENLSEKLQNLTEIEEMLIAQIFLVILIYYLHGGQYVYKGNVINFSQDVHEFTTRLSRNLTSLDVFVVYQQSANGSMFRDFNVHHDKIAQALS